MFVMALLLKLDFNNVYDIAPATENLNTSSFITELTDGSTPALHINISSTEHELLPGVFNLAFGPLNKRGQIDDAAKLEHRDYSKVFSTILVEARSYLINHPGRFLGIDGSDNGRAYLYHRFIQRNFDYLTKHFKLYGTKYYVRITRFGKRQYDNPFDYGDVLPELVPLKKETLMNAGLLYNYYVFKLK